MAKITEAQKLTIATLLAGALGAGVVASLPDGEVVATRGDLALEATTTKADPASPTPKLEAVDVAAYTAAIAPVRADNPALVDLLSAPVDPGAEVETEVVIAAGARVLGVPTYVGDAADAFTTLALDHVDQADGTLVRIHARNDGATRLRLVAIIEVGP